MVGALQLGAGPGVENVVAARTAVVGNPALLVFAALAKAILVAAMRAMQAFGVDELHELLEIAILGAPVDSLVVHGSFPWFPLALVPSPQAMKGRAAWAHVPLLR